MPIMLYDFFCLLESPSVLFSIRPCCYSVSAVCLRASCRRPRLADAPVVEPGPHPAGQHNRCKAVVLLDAASGAVLREFVSGRAASVALGVPPSAVSLSVSGKVHSAQGHVLRFKDPPEPSTEPPIATSAAASAAVNSDTDNDNGDTLGRAAK